MCFLIFLSIDVLAFPYSNGLGCYNLAVCLQLVCQNAVNAVVQDGIRLMCGTSLTNITSLYPLSIVALKYKTSTFFNRFVDVCASHLFSDGTFLLAAYMEQSHISYLTSIIRTLHGMNCVAIGYCFFS